MAEHIRVRAGQRLHLSVDEGELLNVLENVADESVQEATTEIKRGNRSGKYRPDGQRRSVRGEAPYNETGELVQSLAVERDVDKVLVGSRVDHGAALETGGREFLAPAIEEATRNERGFVKILKVEAK